MSDIQDPKRKEEYLEQIRSYKPIHDTFMRNLFRNSTEVVEMVLRIILDKPDLKVTSSGTQVDLIRLTGSRGLCLDVLATDSTGKMYDIEVQRDISGAEPERARFHASAMDVENSNRGMDFNQLPEVYVIFITEKDFFGDNESIYEFETLNTKKHFPLNDGRHILYVNGQYRSDTDIGKLMHDFNCSDPDEMLIPILAERTRYLKTDEKEVRFMCEQMERIRNEGKAESEAKTARNLKKIGMGDEEIAKILETDVNRVEELLASGEKKN